jgi:hypothetical protein
MESDPLARRERQIAVPRADVLSQCFVAELHLVLVAGLVVVCPEVKRVRHVVADTEQS